MIYIANYIGGILSKNNIIIKQEEPIYIYGAELILNFLAAIVTFFLISIFFNQMFNTLIFIAVFCVLRGYAGGYHASSFIKCYILSVSIFIILMLLNKYLSIDFKMALVWPLFLLGQLVLVLRDVLKFFPMTVMLLFIFPSYHLVATIICSSLLHISTCPLDYFLLIIYSRNKKR